MTEKKILIYFALILIGATIVHWLMRKENNSMPVAIDSPGDDSGTVSAEYGTSNPQQSPVEVAPAQLTYNAPSNIMAAVPSTQSYLTHSQTASLISGGLTAQLQNAVSTGLVE